MAGIRDHLLDLSKHSEEEAAALVLAEYQRLYLAAPLKTHDDEVVVFWRDRFEHAFYTTHDRVNRLYAKSKFCPDRGTRVRWIGEVIRCKVPDVECWSVKPKDPARFRDKRSRLYVIWSESYVIWLEPRKETGWKFSSAYVCNRKDIGRYTKGGTKIWPKKEPRDLSGSRGEAMDQET